MIQSIPLIPVILYLFSLFVLFLIRSVYTFHGIYGGDAYGHFLQIQDIKDAGHRRPDRPSKSVMSGKYAYPYFFLWIMSFINRNHYATINRYFSGISDVVFGLTFALLVPLGILKPRHLPVAVLLLIFTPQFMRPDQSHGKGFSQRKPGLILLSILFIAFLGWVQHGYTALLVVCGVLGGLVCLTSKFGFQAFIFISIGLGVFVDPMALILVPSSIVVATVMSGGRYPHILKGHLRHLYHYATTRQYQQFDHSRPEPIVFLRSWYEDAAKDGVLSSTFEHVYRNPLIVSTVNNPHVLLSIGVYAIFISGGWSLPVHSGYGIWLMSGVSVTFLTSLPHLLFLGQPERYLEYVFVPSAVLILHGLDSYGFVSLFGFIGVLFGGFVIELVYVWSAVNIFASQERRECIEDLIEELKKLEQGVTVIQPNYLSRQVAWETGNEVIEDLGGHTVATPEARREKDRVFSEGVDGIITDDIDWLNKKYSPEWVVFDLEKLSEKSEDGDLDNAPGLGRPPTEPVYRNDRFELYRFDDLCE